MRFFSPLLIIAMSQTLAGACQENALNTRNRPSDESEGAPGYIVQSVKADEAAEVQFEDTILRFEAQTLNEDFRVQLRRNELPSLNTEEKALLGSPLGSVVAVEIFENDTER